VDGVARAFDIVEQGVVCLDLPEIAPRARREKRVQQIFNESRVVLCNDTAMHLLGIVPEPHMTGRQGKDILPASDDFIDAMLDTLSSKSGKQTFAATREVKGVGFRILQYNFHQERTPGLPLRLWFTVTEMS
jgi:PAS domain-containing protein